MKTIEQNTIINPLEQFRQGLEKTIKIETSGNNLGAELAGTRSKLEELLAKTKDLPPINENALALATSEQKVSVSSLKTTDYAYLVDLENISLKLEEVIKSTQIDNKETRIKALQELYKEVENYQRKFEGKISRNNNHKASLIKSLRNGFNNILPFNKKN
jgi:hypothetical protein